MKTYRIDCSVYVEVEDGVDPEDVAQEFDRGIERSISGFPAGEIISAGVNEIREVGQQELEEKGLVE